MVLTINNFDKYVNQGVVERGKRLFGLKRVYDITQTNEGAWAAYVEGTNDEYAVRIAFKDEEIVKSNCTCPYDGNICKHAVALLFELRKQFKEVLSQRAETLVQGEDGVFRTKNDNNVNKDYSPTGLYTAYKALPESEQRVIKIAALVYEPFSMTKLIEVFNSSFQHMGKGLTASWAKIWLMELNQAAFLLYLPTGQYRIKADFADYLLDNDFEKDRDFRVLIPRIRRIMELTAVRYRDFEPSERYFREVRFAYYLNNLEEFRSNYFLTIQHNSGTTKYSQQDLLQHFLPSVFNLERLEKIPLTIRGFLLAEQMIMTYVKLAPTDAYFDYAIANLDKLDKSDHSNVSRLAAQVAMFKGDWLLVGQLSR